MAPNQGELKMKNLKQNSALFYSLILLAVTLLPILAFADDPTKPVDSSQFWVQLVAVLSGLKGISTIGAAVLLSQLVMTFFRTQFGDFAGIWKLVIVTGLSLLVTILGNLQSGMNFMAALFAGGTIAAVQVFVNEILKHVKQASLPQPQTPVK